MRNRPKKRDTKSSLSLFATHSRTAKRQAFFTEVFGPIHMHITSRHALLGIVFCCALVPGPVKAEPSPVGTWTVTGRDELGTRWTATLFLEPKDQNEYPPTRLKGFFDWEGSNETGGREYVVLATFDYDTRVLKLHGAELEDADPNIAAAIYTVSMTKEADKLLDGTWTGESVCPGVWEATRLAEQASPKKAAGSSRKAGSDSSRCKDGRCPTQ